MKAMPPTRRERNQYQCPLGRYIQSEANGWADRIIKHLENDDLQLDPVLFVGPDAR
jgi:hypothetical protein